MYSVNITNAEKPLAILIIFITMAALFTHYCCYCIADRNKRRQKITQKIAQEKKRLLEDIQRYNQQPDGDLVDTDLVVQKLSNKAAESMIWPWQEHNTGVASRFNFKYAYNKFVIKFVS